jgi:hypothetical protein
MSALREIEKVGYTVLWDVQGNMFRHLGRSGLVPDLIEWRLMARWWGTYEIQIYMYLYTYTQMDKSALLGEVVRELRGEAGAAVAAPGEGDARSASRTGTTAVTPGRGPPLARRVRAWVCCADRPGLMSELGRAVRSVSTRRPGRRRSGPCCSAGGSCSPPSATNDSDSPKGLVGPWHCWSDQWHNARHRRDSILCLRKAVKSHGTVYLSFSLFQPSDQE